MGLILPACTTPLSPSLHSKLLAVYLQVCSWICKLISQSAGTFRQSTMSGIELAGLVLPILIESIKSYRTVQRKIHTARHSAHELIRIENIFRFRKQMFYNQCELLLRIVLEDKADAKAMIKDTNHDGWSDQAFHSSLERSLGGSYEACEVVLREIGGLLKEMEKELNSYATIHHKSPARVSSIDYLFSVPFVRHHMCDLSGSG